MRPKRADYQRSISVDFPPEVANWIANEYGTGDLVIGLKRIFKIMKERHKQLGPHIESYATSRYVKIPIQTKK